MPIACTPSSRLDRLPTTAAKNGDGHHGIVSETPRRERVGDRAAPRRNRRHTRGRTPGPPTRFGPSEGPGPPRAPALRRIPYSVAVAVAVCPSSPRESANGRGEPRHGRCHPDRRAFDHRCRRAYHGTPRPLDEPRARFATRSRSARRGRRRRPCLDRRPATSRSRRRNPSSVIRKDGQKSRGTEFFAWQIEDVHEASYDMKARVGVLDEHGLYAQILYPNVAGFGSQNFMKVEDGDLRLACARIYNEAMAEIQADSGDRLLPMALMPLVEHRAERRGSHPRERHGLEGPGHVQRPRLDRPTGSRRRMPGNLSGMPATTRA